MRVPFLASIQVLRGFAALVVTIAHTNAEVGWWAYVLHFTNPMPSLVTGAAGVDLFFVISGFVMVYTTSTMARGPAVARDFFLRRLIRIVPMYWIATFAFLSYILYIGHSWLQEGIANYNVVCSLAFIPCQNPNGSFEAALAVGWSLNFEMFFYVIFALSLLLPRVVGFLIVVVTLSFFGIHGVAGINLPGPMMYLLRNEQLLEFAAGMLIAAAFVNKVTVPRWLAISFLVVGLGAMIVYATFDLELVVRNRALRWGLPCSLIVLGMVYLEDSVARWPGATWLLRIGDMSYTLYLFHGLIMNALRVEFTNALEPVARWPWVYSAVAVLVCLAACDLIYRFIEAPITRALHAALTRRRLVAAATPAQ